MKKLLSLIIVLFLFAAVYAQDTEPKESNPIIDGIADYYSPDPDKSNYNVFFPFYASESGFTAGHFYYDTNLFNTGAYVENILMYAPFTNIFLEWFKLKRLPLADKWYVGSEVILVNFEEVRMYATGNDSENKKASYTNLDGYDFGKGFAQYYDINISREIAKEHSLKSWYAYKQLDIESKLQDSTLVYKTDKLGLEWEYNSTISKVHPREGNIIILGGEKSLSALSHDDENEWNYYRLSLDLRHYFALFERSAFALRFFTMHLDYLDEPDDGRNTHDLPTLGSFNVFRAYYYMRFKDKNFAVWQGEYRFPLNKQGNLQATLLGEAGRVGSEYNRDLFVSDLKWDAGFGLRFLFNESVLIRADLAYSTEQTQVRAASSQAF